MKIFKNRQAYIHIIIAVILIIKGFGKMSHHYFLIGGFVLLSGVCIIGYVMYERNKETHSPIRNIFVHLCEALMMLFVTYIYINEGTTYIKYFTFVISMILFINAFVHYQKLEKSNVHNKIKRK